MEMERGSCKPAAAPVILILARLLEIRLLDCGFLARKSSEEQVDWFEESSVAAGFGRTAERSNLRFPVDRLRSSSGIQLPVVEVIAVAPDP
jgi:hypothetical protein